MNLIEQILRAGFVHEYSPILLPEAPIYVITIASFLFFALVYRTCHPIMMQLFPLSYGKLSNNDRVEWNSRVVSNVHAVIAVMGSLYVLFFSDSTEYVREINVVHGCDAGAYMLTFSLGYFLYDTIIVLINYKQLGGVSMMFHHISAILCVCIVNMYHKFMLFPLFFSITEITTPFVNQRFFLDKANMKSSKRYTFNGLLMWLGFVLFRCSLIPISLHIIYTQGEMMVRGMPAFVRFVVYAQITNMSILNTYWTYKITKGIISVFTSKKK